MSDHLADRFAHMEAEFKALKKQYEALKAEALEACMAKAGDDLTAFIAGDMFALEFSLTPVNQFSLEKAKAFLTADELSQCYTQTTRQNLKPKLLANVKVVS
jgi:phosphopantetheinyl transferase (holo-ACP synthase)